MFKISNRPKYKDTYKPISQVFMVKPSLFFILIKFLDTGLPTKDETVKTTLNSLNMSCTEYSLLIGYKIIFQKKTSLQLLGVMNINL